MVNEQQILIENQRFDYQLILQQMSQRSGRMRGVAVNQRNFQDSNHNARQGLSARNANQAASKAGQNMNPQNQRGHAHRLAANPQIGIRTANPKSQHDKLLSNRLNDQYPMDNGPSSDRNNNFSEQREMLNSGRNRLQNTRNKQKYQTTSNLNHQQEAYGAIVQDSFMDENFDDSYDQYQTYKDKPKGDSFYHNVNQNASVNQNNAQQIRNNKQMEMEFPVNVQVQRNKQASNKGVGGYQSEKYGSSGLSDNLSIKTPPKVQNSKLQQNAKIQNNVYTMRSDQYKQNQQTFNDRHSNIQSNERRSDQLQKPKMPGQIHPHFKSILSEEREAPKRGAGGMKNYLKHTNNQHAVLSPKSDFSGGAISNLSSQSELKYHVNTSIKMKTPNQTAVQRHMQDRSSYNDSLQKYESNTQQSVLLSPSMNNKTTVGGKTPQERQPSQITHTSGGMTPGTIQNKPLSRQNASSHQNSLNQAYNQMNRKSNPVNNYARDNSYNNEMMFPGQSQSNLSNSNQHFHQMNSSNMHNTSKNESSGQNGSIKMHREQMRGSLGDSQQDKITVLERTSWKLGEINSNNMGPRSVYNVKGRKTEDFGLESQVQNARASGIVSTPQIQQTKMMSRNTINQLKIGDDMSNLQRIDSDNGLETARMDDTDEYQPPRAQVRKNQRAQNQGKRRADHMDEDDDCEVPDEDIGINSLSCERQTVNSQGVLSMKDFQSLSKRNIFQRKMNKTINTSRGNYNRNSDHQQQSYSKTMKSFSGPNDSPSKKNLLKVSNGPIIGRPLGYAEQRLLQQKEQKQSLFKHNQELQRELQNSSQERLSHQDMQGSMNYHKLISNSSQKPSINQNESTGFSLGKFNNTYDQKNIDKKMMNVIHDNQQRSRQNSFSNINSYQSQNSRQSRSNMQIEERIVNQNGQNVSPTKAQPGFKNRNVADHNSQFDNNSLSRLPMSEKGFQSHRAGMQNDVAANSVSNKSGMRSSRVEKSTGQQPHQKMQSPIQNMRQSSSQINTAVQVRQKTKAGIVSPQGLVTDMQCICQQIQSNRESNPRNPSRLASSRLGNHARQKSKPSNPVSMVDQNPPEITTQTDDDYNVSLTQSISEIDKLDSSRAPQVCGKYCKNLTAEQERNIILQCLKDSIAQHFDNLQGKSIEEFKSSMVSEVEQSKYTAKHFQSLNMINARENDKRYLISASWWREWCDYTDFNLNQLQLKTTSQIMHGSFTKLQQSGVVDKSSGNSPRSNMNQFSNQTRQENPMLKPDLQINFRNQNMTLHMESSQVKNKEQDLSHIREFTHESTIQQIQLSTQMDKEHKIQNHKDRHKNDSRKVQFKIEQSPQQQAYLQKPPTGSKAGSQLAKGHPSNSNLKKSSMVHNNYLTMDSSLEHNRSRHGKSNRQNREVSFRKASSIVESESQYSVKDSVRQRQADFNKELQLLKLQNRNKDQQIDEKKPQDGEYDMANEQDSIAINTDSFKYSDRRGREQTSKFFENDKDESLQSGTFMKKILGGYKKPAVIENAELLKDPSVVKDILEQNMGNKSPSSPSGGVTAGRKMVGSTGNSQQNMNYMYMILKDDLIEHFDYEAVNMQIFQLFRAWYGIDIQIMRFIKRDHVNRTELFLDLYPEKRLANNHYQQSSSGQKQRQSRYQMKPESDSNDNMNQASGQQQSMMRLSVPQVNQNNQQQHKKEGHRFFRRNND